MKKFASILRLDFLPASIDVGLLVLRLWLGLSLLLLHGLDKARNFQKMSGGFPDPLHLGHAQSLILSMVGEVLCPVLIILGLFTRLGALGSMINMMTAFFRPSPKALGRPQRRACVPVPRRFHRHIPRRTRAICPRWEELGWRKDSEKT